MEAKVAKRKIEKEATEKMESIKLVLPNMSKQYRKCDPAEQKEGETYFLVTKLLQGYIDFTGFLPVCQEEIAGSF